MGSLPLPRFGRAKKACFTSKQACFTRLRLGFTYASLRLLQVFSLGSNTERPEVVSSSSLALHLADGFTSFSEVWKGQKSVLHFKTGLFHSASPRVHLRFTSFFANVFFGFKYWKAWSCKFINPCICAFLPERHGWRLEERLAEWSCTTQTLACGCSSTRINPNQKSG